MGKTRHCSEIITDGMSDFLWPSWFPQLTIVNRGWKRTSHVIGALLRHGPVTHVLTQGNFLPEQLTEDNIHARTRWLQDTSC